MKKLLLTQLLLLLTMLAHAQTTIALWTFEGDVTTPAEGNGTISLIGGTTSTFAAGNGGGRAFNTTTYEPATGGVERIRGVEFKVNTTGLKNIKLSFDIRHSNTSSNTIVVQYSTNNGQSFTDYKAIGPVPAGDAWYSRTVDFSEPCECNNLELENNANAIIRVVQSFDYTVNPPVFRAATSTSNYSPTGTMRFDNVKIEGVKNFTLQLLHTSDMEAGLLAINAAPNAAAIIDSLEDTYPNTLKLSGGDNYIPSPFLNASSDPVIRTPIRNANKAIFSKLGVNPDSSNFLRENYARADLSFMHAIGYHASAVGNHEFDLGPAVFSDAIRIELSGTELRWMGAQFPYLSCNLDYSGESALNPHFTNTIRNAADYATTPATARNAAFRAKLAPATFVEIGGERIGIVGATTQVLETISSTGGVRVKGSKTNNMTELATFIQPFINDLISVHGCNKIILLSHLQQIAFEKELVGLLSGVDIIVAAGSHTLQADDNDVLRAGDTKRDEYPTITKDKDGNDALIVCTDGEWKYVGRLVVDFDPQGKLVLSSLNNAINGAYATDDAGVARVYGSNISNAFAANSKGKICKDLADAIQNVITAQDGNIFGKTAVFMEGRRVAVRQQETNFGSLSAEANLWYAKKVDPTVMVSIKNGGGIRSAIGEVKVDGATNITQLLPPQANPLANKQTGDVSQLDILNSLRFNNGLTLVTVTAAQLREVVEHGVSAWTATATPGQFPQVAGIRFRFDPSRPANNRVRELMIVDSVGTVLDVVVQRGQVVGDPNRLIRVVSLNFLVDQSGAGPRGGDNYPFNIWVLENPTRANKVSITKANNDPKTGNATFANDGSEQDAFAEFMYAKYKDTPYAKRDTTPAGDFTIQNLRFHSDFFNSSAREVMFTTNTGVKVTNGGFGSGMTNVPGKLDEFYILTDRGPNADSAGVAGKKVFSNPSFAPQIGKFKLKGDSITLLEKITLKRANGTPLTGLPNPVGFGSTGEIAYDLDFNLLSPDQEGIDTEGLVALPDGTFWVSDEYGPHIVHLDAMGRTIERINPFGNGRGGRKIPTVFAKRWANRGMEGLTITPSGMLVGIMQSRLYNPSQALATNTRLTRILMFDTLTGATKQFLYIQEINNGSNSGITAISDTSFLVIERDQNFQGGTPNATVKRIYKINISEATDVSDPADGANGLQVGGKSLEELTVAQLAENNIFPVKKTLMADLLLDMPYYPHDKLEGMAIINDSTIVVINDDDFAVEANSSGSYNQKKLRLNGVVDNNVLYYVKLRSKITNIGGKVTSLDNEQATGFHKSSLMAYPNPATDEVILNKTVTGTLFDVLGNQVMKINNSNKFNVQHLKQGVYVLKAENESLKLVVR
ncbi:MAG: esterase-like activity of phytase family protein [Cytophagales bacterium]